MTRKSLKDALLTFLLLAVAYSYFYHDPAWNGNSRLALVYAVVREGRLTIDSFHDQPGIDTGDKALYEGHYYSDKAIGTALAGVAVYAPVYAATRATGRALSYWGEKYLLTILVISLPSALAGAFMYLLCMSVSGSRRRAYLATASIMLGTMAFPYSAIYYGHQLAAVFLFTAFYLIFRLKSAGELRAKRVFLVGLLLGLALITEYTTAVVVLPLVLYYFHALWTQRAALFSAKTVGEELYSYDEDATSAQREESVRASAGRARAERTRARRGIARAVALPAFGGTLPLLLTLAYNYACFGSPFSLAYSHMENPLFKEGMSQGVMGVGWPSWKALYYLTVHYAHGLFWQSPVLLMSVAGFFFMLRAKGFRAEALLGAVALAAYLFVNAGYYMWWGGWSFGPRHLIPALPFLALPLLFLPKRAQILVAALALVSVFQMFIVNATVIDVPDAYLLKIEELGFFDYSSIYDFCWPRFLAGQLSLNPGALFGLERHATLLPLMLPVALLCAVILLRLRRDDADGEIH